MMQVQEKEILPKGASTSPSVKAKTRTIIQVGGLLNASELFKFFGIEAGEDLQASMLGQQKSATLLGVLVDLSNKLRERAVSESKLMQWRRGGMKYLSARKANSSQSLGLGKYTRKEQSRTKAQGGGLLILSNLFDYFDIKVGEDLQTTLVGCQKSATLLGALVELRVLLESKGITDSQRRQWKSVGTKLFVRFSDV